MNPERARRRRIRRRVLFGVGGLLIVAAAVVALASLAFPWLLAHPERVQQFLSERLKQPVTFASLDGEWLPSGPVFRLRDLRVGSGSRSALTLDRAELVFDFYAPFKPDVPWHELRVMGLDIDAERSAEGRFRIVQWRGSGDTVGKPLDALSALGAFRISDSSLGFHDLGSDSRLRLTDIDIAVSPRVGGQRLLGQARLAGVAPVAVRCDLAGDFRAGRCYAQAHRLPVGDALADVRVAGIAFNGGQADLALWTRFRRGEITDGRIELAATAMAMRGVQPVRLGNGETIEARYSPDDTRIALQWNRTVEREQFMLLEGPDLAPTEPTRSKLSLDRARNGGDWTLHVEHLSLARLMPWLSLSDLPSPGTAGWLYEAAPSGHLRDLDIVGNGRDVARIRGDLTDVALSATRRSPRIADIDAQVFGDGEAVALRVQPVDTVIDFPSVLPTALPVRIAQASVVVAREGEGVRVEVPDLSLIGDDFGLDGWLALRFDPDGRRPFMDAVIDVRDSAVVAAKGFWPLPVMPQATRAWLDRALVGGRIVRGVATIRGDLDDWPFHHDEGIFTADADIADLQLDYHPDWPAGRLRTVEARFRNGGMTAHGRDGRLLDATVADIRGRIASFRDPVLELDGQGSGSGEALLAFMKATPLNRHYRDELAALRVGGTGTVDFDLKLPLAARLGEPVLNGRATLAAAELAESRWGLRFTDASGDIRFSRDGFAADGLAVRVDDDAATFAIAVGSMTVTADHSVEASLRGDMKASSALAAVHLLDPYWPRVNGVAHWNIALAVPRSPDPEQPLPSLLTVQSDLRGIALDLPAPLGKDSESPMPLDITAQLPVAGRELSVQLGALARFRARMPTEHEPFAGHLALGGELPVVPQRPGLRITGQVPSIDLAGWSLIGGTGEGDATELLVDVQASELDVLGRAFANTHLRIDRDARVSHIRLLGDGIDGGFDVPRADVGTRGLTLQFEKLHWPEADVATVQAQAAHPTDPSRLPPLHIWARDLKLGAASFGEARIETQPMPGGLRIEQFDTRSPTLTMRASGEWTLAEGRETSRLDATLSSESLGKMLASLGYAGVIDGGQTVARIRGHWAGSPAQFGLANLNGELSGEVGEGRILNVEPGAGRIFGLVNFTAIPRRLSLDFRDFFQTGMAFDRIRGSFTLAEGSAHTADLEIVGPAADIRISGRTGLRARDYEQDMEVTPKLRGALPIVGAVAGGPMGAVVGVLAQEVMRKPIDEVVSSRYRVRGSWDKPDITLIGKTSRRIATPDADGSGGSG